MTNISKNKQHGKLYLIPTTLGEQPARESLPNSVKQHVTIIDHYIVENEKTARRFIKKIAPTKEQQILRFFILNKRTPPEDFTTFLNPCKHGTNMGLLSEAGCPGIADPGAEVVNLAHQENIKVVPLVGPSSIFLTLMSSGLNGQHFSFNGYLPIDKTERKQQLKKLERLSLENNQAQIFIETPYRNNQLLNDFLQHLHPDTKLCIGCDVTLISEYIRTKPIAQWKKHLPDLHKKPAIFIFQRM